MWARQIRWENLVRAAAITAAAIAAVGALPSLLSGGAPPPEPDVGLATVAAPASDLAASEAPVDPTRAAPPLLGAATRRLDEPEKAAARKAKARAARAKAASKTGQARRARDRGRTRSRAPQDDDPGPVTQSAYAPPPVYRPPAPVSGGREFRFEQ